MYIILTWSEGAEEYVLPEMNEDGTAIIFDTKEDAEKYGADELEGGCVYWQVVNMK